MKNRWKRLLLVFLAVSMLFQQTALPLAANTTGITTVFTDSKEKAGTAKSTARRTKNSGSGTGGSRLQMRRTGTTTSFYAAGTAGEYSSGAATGNVLTGKNTPEEGSTGSGETSGDNDETTGEESEGEDDSENGKEEGQGGEGTGQQTPSEGGDAANDEGSAGTDAGQKEEAGASDDSSSGESSSTSSDSTGIKNEGQNSFSGESEKDSSGKTGEDDSEDTSEDSSVRQESSVGGTDGSSQETGETEQEEQMDTVFERTLNRNLLRAAPRANNGINMPKATYETFILQGKEGKGQKIGNSGKVTMLPSRRAIQNDITANHNDYVSFTPHWGADTTASLSTRTGSRSASYYVNDPKKAQHVGGIGLASMTPNIVGGRVYKLEASMKNNLSCTYYNVGRYYDRSSGKSYAIDMKAVVTDFKKKPNNTADVQNAMNDGALGDDGGPLFCFIGGESSGSIGVLTTFCDAVKLQYSFYIHGTQTPIHVKGFTRFRDVDAQQGIEFSGEADYFYAIEDANDYLGYSKGVYNSGSKAYIYALSSAAVSGNPGSSFYTLFSGSQLTLRYTFAKCSRQDDGGPQNGSDLTKYKVPFDNSDVKDYSTSSSSGYIHFDARQPYLAQPEIQKTVFNGNDIQAEIQTPHTAVSNDLSDLESVYTYKIRTVCPYEDASEHHYSSWVVTDRVSPYLNVEQAVIYDGTGNRSSDFRIQTQAQGDGSTLVTATALNPAAQSFYEKNWYDLYITVRVRTQEQLESLNLDFAGRYVSGGTNAGRYILTNHAVLSTGTDYTSNEVQTRIPQQIKVRKVNEKGDPIRGITFGIFTSPDADINKDKPLMTAVTDENGTAHFKTASFYNLAGKAGPYYIREVSRGDLEDVYILDEKWNYAFSSDKGNTVVYGEEKDKKVSTLEDVAKVLKQYTVRIRKKNKETSDFLKGAEFALYQWSEAGKSYMKVYNLEECVDDSGQVYYRNPEDISATEDNLGHFMVKEEQAPYGCYNAGQSWTFAITDAYVENENNIEFLYTSTNGRKRTQKKELIYSNDLQKGILRLVKTDDVGEYVKGAVFTVKAAEDIYAPWQYQEDGTPAPNQEPLVPKGTVCDSMTTDENGSSVSKRLYIGKYQITETGGAPDHVQSDEVYEVEFTYPEKDDIETVEETVQAGNVIMRPSFAVAKIAERTRNPEGEEVDFDKNIGRYSQEKVPGIYNAEEMIRYQITLTNTGNTNLYHIRLHDSMEEVNEAGQKLADYVDKDRASFIVPATGSYETNNGERITASLSSDNGTMVLFSKLSVGDSITVWFEVPVGKDAANVYNLINTVTATASYDNNAERPGRNLIPVNTEELVDENGNSLTEDEDRIHIPGTPDNKVLKVADRTTGGVVTDGEFNGVKVPGLYYEGDTVCFDIYIKNSGTANLKNILVTDVMSEELKQVVDVNTATFRLEDVGEESEEESLQDAEDDKESAGSDSLTAGAVSLRTTNGEIISARQIDASRVILCENVDTVTGKGMLRPGDVIKLQFYAVVKKDAANFYDLMNTVIVNASYFTGKNDEPVPEQTDTDIIELPGVPEAKIAKIADRTTGAVLVDGRYQNEKITGSYDKGNEIVFTITVTNSGTSDLYDLKVRDVMEDRLVSALQKESIRFQDGNYTSVKGETIKATAGKGTVLYLDYMKAGDSVNLLLRAVVNEKAGDLFKLENKVYVTGHYRKGNEQYQQQYEDTAEAAGHTYVMEYHANNGTTEKTSDSETPAYEGDLVHINGNPFAWEGYEFLGWNTRADGTGQDYAAGAEYQMPAKDVHLYARWGSKGSILKKNYTYALTYHSNNPLSQAYPDSETRCVGGTVLVLDENYFVYNGYRFVGWSQTPEEKEDLLQPGESYRMPKKDIHLYAQWEKEEKVVLTYHSNIPNKEQEKTDFQTPCTKGSVITVKQCEFEREDYRFVGWSTDKDSTEADIHPQDALTLEGDRHLYAVWEKKVDGQEQITYRLFYHGNNETNDSFMDSATPCVAGDEVVLQKNLFTYHGYTFKGWNTKADGTGKQWETNASYTMPDRNVHLYAQWQKISEYTLTYLSNYPNKKESVQDEKRIDSETPCPENTSVRIDGCVFQCDGYQFLGWSLTPDGSAALIMPEVQYTLSSDTELYAIWSDDCEEYSLLYSSNTEGAIWEAAPGTPVPADTPQTLIQNPFSNSKAVFVGWSLEEDATPESENLLQPGQRFEQPARDTVLYAVWKETQSRNVYYDGNGGRKTTTENAGATEADGRVPDTETPCVSGTGIRIDPSMFQRDGFRFLGWSTEIVEPLKATGGTADMTWEQAIAQTEILYPGCAYTVPDKDTILYAVWEELPKTTFDGDHAAFDGDELADSLYTPIPVTELMRDQDYVNIPGEPDLRVAKKADKTKGVTLKKGRYEGKRKPGTYYEGDRVVYTITVSNYGTATAYKVKVKEIPSSAWKKALEAEGFTASAGETLESVKGNSVQIQKKTDNVVVLDNLKPEDSITLTFEAVIKAEQVKEGFLKNTVKVTGKKYDGTPVAKTKYMTDNDVINIKEETETSRTNTGSIPKTGDNNPIAIWLFTGLSGLFIMVAVVILRIYRRIHGR